MAYRPFQTNVSIGTLFSRTQAAVQMQSQIEFLPAQYDLCIVFSKMRSSLGIQSFFRVVPWTFFRCCLGLLSFYKSSLTCSMLCYSILLCKVEKSTFFYCLFRKLSTVVSFRQITVSCGRKRAPKVRVYYETTGSILRPRNENLVFDLVVFFNHPTVCVRVPT